VIKRQHGHIKARYRGLTKNGALVLTLCALSNRWMTSRYLLEKESIGAHDGRIMAAVRGQVGLEVAGYLRGWGSPRQCVKRQKEGDYECGLIRPSPEVLRLRHIYASIHGEHLS
jgi:hypothetical protein